MKLCKYVAFVSDDIFEVEGEEWEANSGDK